ncbi:hypothetical protein ACJMK2_031349 [Sinanodonta woodiana]|uniref:Uncharacterized protein n=1 Tax=Sinanodonta woodiana TaxID=1069815 RepID=A0ABD3WYI2_SINWO
MARHCNENAFKENRKVELGWIHNGKQVRTAKGGGTRKIELPRNSRKEEVLDKAKTLFFPTNHALHGSIVNFIFKLTDFSNREIQNETIEELYESSKVSLLRLYMVTKKKRFTQYRKSHCSRSNKDTL